MLAGATRCPKGLKRTYALSKWTPLFNPGYLLSCGPVGSGMPDLISQKKLQIKIKKKNHCVYYTKTVL